MRIASTSTAVLAGIAEPVGTAAIGNTTVGIATGQAQDAALRDIGNRQNWPAKRKRLLR